MVRNYFDHWSGVLLKILKIFWNHFKYFYGFPRVKIVEVWLVYGNKFFQIAQSYILTKTIKQS